MPLDQLIRAAEAARPKDAATSGSKPAAPAITLWADRIGAR